LGAGRESLGGYLPDAEVRLIAEPRAGRPLTLYILKDIKAGEFIEKPNKNNE